MPFKKILYRGRKGVPKGRQLSKNRIHLKLARKAEKVDSNGKQRRGVFDGAGCNRTVLPYFHSSPDWAGFVCKFPRIRNIETETGVIHIRKYLSQLSQDVLLKQNSQAGLCGHIHRKLKAIMHFLELANVAYCFLEYRRLKARDWQDSLSEIRNGPIQDFEKNIALKYNLTAPKHAQKAD